MMSRVGMLLVTVMVVLTACQTPTESTQQNNPKVNNDVSELNWQVPAFSYTNQNNEQVTLDDLKGKVWLADFIFTHCPNICPPMTANMAKVQETANEKGLDIQIVSFSVDPKNDTPEVLAAYGKEKQIDFKNWDFLTGYSVEEIQKFGKEAFKAGISQQPGPSEDIPVLVNHPPQFYLIDQTGAVVTFYNGLEPDYDKIVQDIKALQ
ncbi:SCO family protein [Hazenella sp. IB182353]|uniref:SCO family protein n=1 Tax=Polycladospora coralii TaxID=2771432 RepID=UPI001747B344|nr:SCO family protein [Polycladospora coralii]MBS7529248.1 SCO family protein [Polycladospora coralii]